MKKSYSWSSDSQEVEHCSQGSTFSDSSDFSIKKELDKLEVSNRNRKLNHLHEVFEEIDLKLSEPTLKFLEKRVINGMAYFLFRIYDLVFSGQ